MKEDMSNCSDLPVNSQLSSPPPLHPLELITIKWAASSSIHSFKSGSMWAEHAARDGRKLPNPGWSASLKHPFIFRESVKNNSIPGVHHWKYCQIIIDHRVAVIIKLLSGHLDLLFLSKRISLPLIPNSTSEQNFLIVSQYEKNFKSPGIPKRI